MSSSAAPVPFTPAHDKLEQLSNELAYLIDGAASDDARRWWAKRVIEMMLERL